jgi:hydroxyacylglutathione hydrolase
MTRVWPVADGGLGNSSYMVEVADGVGLVVDPGRDPRPYLWLAAQYGLRIGFSADTHVHADFVSGGRELAGMGARLLAPAEAGLAFWARAGAFAASHVPGSVSNELRPAFATWLGWLTDPHRPLVAVLGAGQDRGELVEACLKVGYDSLAGELDGGIAAWQDAGLANESIPLPDPDQDHMPNGCRVLDVRQDSEWAAGHLSAAAHCELGSLAGPAAVSGLPDVPLAVMCGHGERAMTAASLLAAAGAGSVAVLRGGPAEWAKVTGRPLEQA